MIRYNPTDTPPTTPSKKKDLLTGKLVKKGLDLEALKNCVAELEKEIKDLEKDVGSDTDEETAGKNVEIKNGKVITSRQLHRDSDKGLFYRTAGNTRVYLEQRKSSSPLKICSNAETRASGKLIYDGPTPKEHPFDPSTP